MEKKIKVSIIVPVYKVEKYLRRSMDSMINQTLDDIEIICINDGSPDNCLSILREVWEWRILVSVSAHNWFRFVIFMGKTKLFKTF